MRAEDKKRIKVNSQALQPFPYNIKRIDAPYDMGLTSDQVSERIAAGYHNAPSETPTRSISQIVRDNLFTLFNIINVILAAIIVAVGHYRNILFLGVAISNTAMSIIQEIRAKRIIDRLSIITEAKCVVIRDGQRLTIPLEQMVIDDIYYITAGNQIASDGVVVKSEGLEVDESLLTGESNSITKPEGANLLSGSFVVSGAAYVRVTAVGQDNYAAKLGQEAKREKKPKSELIRSLDQIIKVLSFAIGPIGITLFISSYMRNQILDTSVLSATAAMIGMIPEGLMLLTGIALAVGSINLARHKTLVQSVPCIETLARVDVLCLDKTGTITDGSISVSSVLPEEGFTESDIHSAVSAILSALPDANATNRALKKKFGLSGSFSPVSTVPFSSARKWSGARFSNGFTFAIGAPEFVFAQGYGSIKERISGYLADGLRVLAVVRSDKPFGSDNSIPYDSQLMGFILLCDTIRSDAPDTFRFFEEQGVTIKVISGDNPLSVSTIAKRAGLKHAERYIDMTKISDREDYAKFAERYTVFGRVSPYQKRRLINALKKNGHTVAMTGDGVNDVLALKEADCSVAMAEGSDAARNVSDFVLLSSTFSSMINVVKEGRRVVNNIERVASLYLVKTIYSTILSLLFIFIAYNYPFMPIQLSPISAVTVGIPSFVLALRPNYGKIRGRFINKVLSSALPASLFIVISLLITTVGGSAAGFTYEETSTMSVLITGTVGLLLLLRVSRPLDTIRKLLVGTMAVLFLSVFIFFGDFFYLENIWGYEAFIYIPLMLTAYPVINLISNLLIKSAKKRAAKRYRKTTRSKTRYRRRSR